MVETEACTVLRTAKGLSRARGDCVLVSLQLRGVALLEQGGRQTQLRPGDFAIYDTQQIYSLKLPNSAQQLVLKVPLRALKSRLGLIGQYTSRAVTPEQPVGALASGFIKLLGEQYGRLDEDTKPNLAEQVLDLLALAMSKTWGPSVATLSSPKALTLIRLKTVVEPHLNDPAFTSSVAASLAGISQRYANALLSAEGTSLEQYIFARRLERCRQALSDRSQAGRSIGEIALEWGFASQAHFGRKFKEAYGATPKDYRAAHCQEMSTAGEAHLASLLRNAALG